MGKSILHDLTLLIPFFLNYGEASHFFWGETGAIDGGATAAIFGNGPANGCVSFGKPGDLVAIRGEGNFLLRVERLNRFRLHRVWIRIL